MLDTIKQVLTTFSNNYNLNIECKDAVRQGDKVKVEVEFTDYNQGGLKTTQIGQLDLPELNFEKKTFTTMATTKRVVKVYNHLIVAGRKGSDSVSMEFNFHDRSIRISQNRVVVFPISQASPTAPDRSLSLLSYYPDLKSEYFHDTFPEVLDEETREYLDKLLKDLVIDDIIMKCLSLYARRKLTGNKLSAEVLQAILDIYDNRAELINVILPLDCEVGTSEKLLAMQIAKFESKRDIIRSVTRGYAAGNELNLSGLQRVINKITKTTDDGLNPVQEDSNSNALAILSLRDKTTFKNENFALKKYESLRLDPKYFVGIIDPSFTADSQIVNIKNLLARSASVTDGEFKVKVMTKDFKPRILDAYTYLTSAILSSDNIDYHKKEFRPDSRGEYSIYQWGDYDYVDSLDKVDYIRYEDSIVSQATAIMPFVNKTQPMRVMLGTHMVAEQSVPVLGAKPSIIYTDVNKEVYHDSDKQVVRSSVGGKVLGVGKEFININNKLIKLPEDIVTPSHTSVKFRMNVQEGDEVKVDAVIAESNSFVDKEFATNVPLLTAYTSYYGLDHEDAVILSESAAKKFGHMDIYEVRIPVRYNKIRLSEANSTENNLDKFNLIKVGAEVKPRDVLFLCNVISKDLDISTDKLHITRVPSYISGTVRSVKFKYYASTRKKGVNNTKYMEYPGMPELKHHFDKRVVEDILREAKATNLSVNDLRPYYEPEYEEPTLRNNIFAEIIIKIDYINPTKVADKFVNFFGGKGTVSKIIPDDMMLRTEDGRVIDTIVSPLAILSRANPSQMYESLLSLICVEFHNELERFFNSKSEFSESQLLDVANKLLWYNDGKNDLRKIYNQSKKYGYVRVRVTSFDKYFTVDVLNDLRDSLKIKDEVKLLDPASGKMIRTPIRIGYQNFYRL